MAIYTKTGDYGETGLFGGSRVAKDHIKVACYGTIDEANATLGIAYSLIEDDELKNNIRSIQNQLFLVGSELASDQKGKDQLTKKIHNKDIVQLEKAIDTLEEKLGPLHGFVIPGETLASAVLHQARAIIRRAEREIVHLEKIENVRTELKQYINRLSDYTFMLARYEVNVAFVQKVKNKLIEKMRRKENSSFELSLSLAKQLAETAVNYADKIGVAITFSLVDIHGHLVLVHRMKNSLLASIDISQNKAFSAVALKMPTHQIGEQAQPGQELYGINQTNQQRIIPFGGGYPLKVNGRMIGGIGVSGGTVSEDMAIAEKVIETFERCLEVSRNEFRIE